MGVYFPQWGKDASAGDRFKIKGSPDGSETVTLRIKVGPLNGFLKHGFLDTEDAVYRAPSKPAYAKGAFHSWDTVEPVEAAASFKKGDKVLLHLPNGTTETAEYLETTSNAGYDHIIKRANGNDRWHTFGSKAKNELSQNRGMSGGYITAIPKPAKAPKPPIKERDGSSGILETLIDEAISERLKKVEDMLTGDFTKRLDIKMGDAPVISVNTPHMRLEKLLRLIMGSPLRKKNKDVYLWGPAGTGKSTAAHQCAQALNRGFAYVSLCPQSSETLLFGFISAGGTYVETEFYRIYRDGGIFCIDEMDNGSAALLNKLNSLLDNGHGSFPCGMVPRHPDFILVATGNTNGNGPTLEFPERRAFDPAFKKRFAYLDWPLDEAQEKLVALSIDKKRAPNWLATMRAVRKAIKDLNIERVIASPRETYDGLDTLAKGFTIEETLETHVFQGAGEDAVKSIMAKAGLN